LSVRRRQPLGESAARAALWLKQSEASIALLDRVRPLNWAAELSRLTRGFETGARLTPQLAYAAAPDLTELRRELTTLATQLSASQDVEQQLLGARARELELEARLAERVGADEFRALAAERFPLPADPVSAHQFSEQLLTTPPGAATQENSANIHVSDDRRDPESLWSQVSRRLSDARFGVRIEIVVGLVSLAAVADGAVRIRAGARLSAEVARRIALHEVEGHVRPRAAGQLLGGVFAAGSAAASEDEEGRAILLEERAGLLDAHRRAELARRYLAAESVRDGAGFWDTVTLLGLRGASAAAAIELSCRVHRGGGLARELIYLTGYRRVAETLARRPELEEIQKSGRVSLAAAALLAGSVELGDDRDMV
jgi:hypothetical protein